LDNYIRNNFSRHCNIEHIGKAAHTTQSTKMKKTKPKLSN